MKPYEVEIFDRQFNFRANALLNSLSWSDDILTIAKNSILVQKSMIKVREKALSGTPGDRTVSCSDYIRIYDPKNNTYYQGVVIEINDKDDYHFEIVFCSLYKLFDHEVLVLADDIKHTTIEAYIAKLIEQEFLNNSDTYQNIEGLTIETPSSSTRGIFDYNETTDIYTVVNILSDLIYPAFKNYMIRLDVELDITFETVTVSIGKTSGSEKVIETNLPNIFAENVTIRSTTDEINKATLYDLVDYTPQPYTYYLHPSNYSYSQTSGTDRLFPVVNAVEYFNSDAIVEEAYFKVLNRYVTSIEKYIAVNKTLSDVEYSELTNGLTHLWDYIKVLEPLSSYNDTIKNWFENQIMTMWSGFAGEGLQPVTTYEELIEEGTGHYLFTGFESTGSLSWEAYKPIKTETSISTDYSTIPPTPGTTGQYEFSLSGNIYNKRNTHASMMRTGKYRLYVIFQGDNEVARYDLTTTIYSPITSGMADDAIAAYKESDQFKTDFAYYKAQNFQSILSGYAKKIFDSTRYKNLIEITVGEADSMIKPLNMKYGQTVNVIHKGKEYKSILTGKELKNGLITLIFGMIRLDLTQILNMKGV